MAVVWPNADVLTESCNGWDALADQRKARYREVGIELVSTYIGDADTLDSIPDSVLGEALVRVCGYLSQSSASVGTMSLDHRSHVISPMKASGAAALLSRYRKNVA